jgi:CRISPR-associated protein Cmr3
VRHYKLTPLDTLFFGDGSPFNAGEAGQMEVVGTFPPSPSTVAGALRAAFARQLGWSGYQWTEDIIAKLGKGLDLGPLRFSGPYLTKDGAPLFPAPLHLLRSKEYLTWLKPGETMRTDIGDARLGDARLGDARLPTPEKRHDPSGEEIKGFKPLEDAYLTREAMEQALSGELPNPGDIKNADRLWASESRTGIQRDAETRTTKEDALYQIVHVRPKRGVALVMGVEGYEGPVPSLATAGGEGRMVGVEHNSFSLPRPPELVTESGTLRYTVTLVTPARLTGDGWRTPGAALDGLPGSVVSGCVGKPIMIGGWDSVKREPLPLRPHVPAGSTWFLEARESEKEKIIEHHGGHLGEDAEWGYGQILIGVWR